MIDCGPLDHVRVIWVNWVGTVGLDFVFLLTDNGLTHNPKMRKVTHKISKGTLPGNCFQRDKVGLTEGK